MAEISPVRSSIQAGIEKVFWESLTTGDTVVPVIPMGLSGALGSVQATGTFNGGTTVTLQVSEDGTNYVTLKDPQGNDISFTAAGRFEFSTAAPYVKPAIASGSSDDVDVTVILRG